MSSSSAAVASLVKALRLTDSNDGKSALVRLVSTHDKDSDWDATETLEAASSAKREAIWKLALDRVNDILERELHREEEKGEGEGEEASPEHMGAIAVLSAIAELAHAFLECSNFPVDEECMPLFHAMQSLHNVLFELASAPARKLQASVASFCTAYWKQERVRREELMPLSIVWLMFQCLGDTVRQSDIRTVYSLRDALDLFDMEDASSETLQQLLLRCSISPKFVQIAEGRKFIAHLLSSSPFGVSVHSCVKHQLPNAQDSLVRQYGDIYFRAWQGSDGEHRLMVESHMVQDFMYSAVHASSVDVAGAVKLVFKAFYKHKSLRGVDGMLARLYSPILWRALGASNAQVRHNALVVLSQAFPVRDAELDQKANEALLDQQYEAITALAGDSDVRVRVLATETICKVLGSFWDMMPLRVIKTMLHLLVKELAFDAASAAVRSAVFRGLTFVLKNKLSHPLVKVALPSLAPLLFDRSSRVCREFCDLLLAVKDIKTIRFFDVVAVDDVTHKLASCTHKATTRKLSELLLNSYFPSEKKTAKPLKRMLRFFVSDSAAALRFCEHLPRFVPESTLAKFVVSLYRCLCRSVSAGRAGETEVDVSEAAVVETVLRAMVSLWAAVAEAQESDSDDSECREEQSLVQYMVSAVSDGGIDTLYALPKLSPAARMAILQLSAHLSPDASPLLCSISMERIAGFPADVSVAEFSPVLQCLFAWRKEADVLVLIDQSLVSLTSGDGKDAQPTLSATLALRYLNHILGDAGMRDLLLVDNRGAAERLCELLGKSWVELQTALDHAAERSESMSALQQQPPSRSRGSSPIGSVPVEDLVDMFSLFNELHASLQLAEEGVEETERVLRFSVEALDAFQYVTDDGLALWTTRVLAPADGKQGPKRQKRKEKGESDGILRFVAGLLTLIADAAAVATVDASVFRTVFSWIETMYIAVDARKESQPSSSAELAHTLLMLHKVLACAMLSLRPLSAGLTMPEFGAALERLLCVTGALWVPEGSTAVQRVLGDFLKHIKTKRAVRNCVVSAYFNAAVYLLTKQGVGDDSSSLPGDEDEEKVFALHSPLVKVLVKLLRESSALCKAFKSVLSGAVVSGSDYGPPSVFSDCVGKLLFHLLPEQRGSSGGRKLVALVTECVGLISGSSLDQAQSNNCDDSENNDLQPIPSTSSSSSSSAQPGKHQVQSIILRRLSTLLLPTDN
jgi:hypothetical protein